jgi:V/A-type H+/Na+-transporting ATPase subunit F
MAEPASKAEGSGNAPRGSSRGFRVVARPGDGLGFRLAGIQVEEVAPGEELKRVAALVADPSLSVLAVEDDVMRNVPESALRRTGAQGLPVILPFQLPRRWGEAPRGEAYVAALIRRAIGYHIKLGPGGLR